MRENSSRDSTLHGLKPFFLRSSDSCIIYRKGYFFLRILWIAFPYFLSFFYCSQNLIYANSTQCNISTSKKSARIKNRLEDVTFIYTHIFFVFFALHSKYSLLKFIENWNRYYIFIEQEINLGFQQQKRWQ